MNISFSILKIRTMLLFGFLYFTYFASAQATFTTPGTTTWTVPPCVTSITVQVWGAGGAGGGTIAISKNGDEACAAAAGGGGGGFTSSTYTVVPGQTYTVVVGAGGIGGAGGAGTWNGGISTQPSAGGIGGLSSFTGNSANLQATGGSGGFGAGSYNPGPAGSDVNVNGTTAGAGGSGSGGTVNFLGGNGAVGNINVAANGGIDKSGGGGGAAGPGGNGGNASHNGATANPPGGIGQALGGNGGNGRYYNSSNNGGFNGNPGLIYGGGGGGALTHRGAYNVGNHVGGAGAPGAVIISYAATGAPNQPSVITGLTPIPCGGYTGTYSVINDPTVTNYTWTFSGTGTITGTGNSITLNATTAGILTVTPSGACDGPPRTFNITLEPAPNPPTSITGNTAICSGNSTTLTAVGGSVGAAGVTTNWFTGSCGGTVAGTGTTLTVSPTSTTTYFVSTTNACGQSTCIQKIVTITNLVGGTATISQTTFCGSTSATLSLTGNTGTIQWQQSTNGGVTWTNIPGGTTSPFTVTGITATTSFQAILSSTGCTSVNSTVVTITSTPSLTPSVAITGAPASSICAGSSVTFTANPTSGGTNPTYQWQINGVNVAGATGSTFTSTTLTNNNVVTVIMTSNDPCASTPTATSAGATITVGGTITPSVAITGAPTSAICAGSSVTFTANPTNGGTNPTYQWQINGVNVAGATGSTFTSTTLANNNVVTVIMTSNDPCASTPTSTSAGATITVGGTITPSVAITGAPASSICAGSSVTFTANPTNGGTNPTYQWQINGVNVPGATGSTFTSTTLGNNNVVTVVMTTNITCATTPTATSVGSTITVSSTINATISSTSIPCGATNTGTATVVASGGTLPYTYNWSPTGGMSATATGLSAGTYSVTITDAAGCSKTVSTTVTGSPGLAIVTSSTRVNCGTKNGTATATATGGSGTITYVWNPGNLPGQTISNLSVGTYTVTATDGSGCSSSATVYVGQNGNLNLQANPYTAVVQEGDSENLNASFSPYIPGTTYNWTPPNGLSCTDCPNPIATPTETTTYNVQITTPDGCTADTNVTLIFKLNCGEFFVPTIFSPNGDGKNDEFKVFGKCVVGLKMKIYDRWGELVFESSDQSFGWDGTYKGQIMNSASFVYLIDVSFADERFEHIKGNVSLVR